MNKSILIVIVMGISIFACQPPENKTKNDLANPFLTDWETPFEVPPFDQIREEHYIPAIKKGIEQHESEINAIEKNSKTADFENTIVALDQSGELLDRVIGVFFPLNSANTNDNMQSIAREISPLLTSHFDNISLNPVLFKRIKEVYDKKEDLGLDDQQVRVTTKYYEDFVRNGANLSEKDQKILREINEELSKLSLQFGENLLAETNKNFKLIIDNQADLAGLPSDVIARAATDARAAGEDNKWVFSLTIPSMIPFLQMSEKRELREKLYRGYFMRGDNDNEFDNKEIIKKIVRLRDRKAKLLGFKNHAEYVIDVNMAKTPAAVYDFLNKLWAPSIKMAIADVKEMQNIIEREGGKFQLKPWDWWYYNEKLRKEKFDINEEEVKQYFSLENAKKGIFYVVEKLYGLKFLQRDDLPVYDEEVEGYEVQESDGSFLGVLYMDFHPRSGKSVGAWSTAFRNAFYKENRRIPTIGSIVMNFTRPVSDAPALLSFDEVTTFFHEFGHALHGLFSDGPYKRTAGRVSRDFVELPSQIMENWAAEPEVMKVYATHYKTGQPIPDELIDKLQKSATFNQGFIAGEYLAASFLDMDYHTAENPVISDVRQFEQESMNKIGLIPEILPRYRSTYFSHIFSGGYSAGYYVYYWAAVLDTDAFNAFKETGDIFNQEYAGKFRTLLETCGSDEGMEIYRKFRGKDPSIEPLLVKRGLN